MKRVAINGLGRIGRVALRKLLVQSNMKIVAVNDLTAIDAAAHLIQFDTIYGPLKEDVKIEDDNIIIGAYCIKYSQEKLLEDLNWQALDIDIVIDCTGLYKDYKKAYGHISAGAKKVILSYPVVDDSIKSIVLGVNEDIISTNDLILSNASCTTNCGAPLLKVIDQKWGVKRGFLTTIHAYTGDQKITDAFHKDLRRSRAAASNIIPTSTGAAKAIAKVYPDLKGKIKGMAYRVPVITGSCVDLLLELENPFNPEAINAEVKRAASQELKGILSYTQHPIVSSDIIANSASGIFDAQLTADSQGLLKVVIWYDNEYGYSSRLIELCKIFS